MQLDVAPALVVDAEPLMVEATETKVSGLVVVPEVAAGEDGPEVRDDVFRILNPASSSALPLRFSSREAAVSFANYIIHPAAEAQGWSWEDLNVVTKEQAQWFREVAILVQVFPTHYVQVVIDEKGGEP